MPPLPSFDSDSLYYGAPPPSPAGAPPPLAQQQQEQFQFLSVSVSKAPQRPRAAKQEEERRRAEGCRGLELKKGFKVCRKSLSGEMKEKEAAVASSSGSESDEDYEAGDDGDLDFDRGGIDNSVLAVPAAPSPAAFRPTTVTSTTTVSAPPSAMRDIIMKQKATGAWSLADAVRPPFSFLI